MEEKPSLMLYSLSATEDPTLFEAYLNLTISNDTDMTPWYRSALAEMAIEHRYFSNVALDFCIEHWDQLGER